MPFKLDFTVPQNKNNLIPNPPGYLPPASAKQISRTSTAPDADTLFAQNRKATELKMRRAWDLALSPAKSLPMQAIMLYFSGSGVQIFSLGMIFMLLTGPITAVFNIFRAFESLRPTPISPITSSSATRKPADVKTVQEPSYVPLAMPMLAYVASQGLV
ncbi:endoplasmic reticulum protein [Kwoniella heveanensis BCC8398]|uniref:ER membrane protein complex subunit 4 n=1 Tax=Kwoniella heveanensis BCC8398 TaxID=1296120 RepID=A0A1B9H0R3_9TREE|nr:endoplasmic reticulum protein [Kwoniella heveanensis BCC8398]